VAKRKRANTSPIEHVGRPGRPVVPNAEQPESATSAPVERGLEKWHRLYALIPSLLAFISTISSLSNGFVSDDTYQVVRNAFVRSLANLPYAFTTSVWSFAADDVVFSIDPYYRPLFNVLFSFNYFIFGLTPWGWHLTNILLHAAVAWMVFVVCSEIGKSKWPALIAASLFAVHPVHAESVAWVSGATDPLMALFLLPAFYFYIRFRRKGGRKFLVAVAVFYLCGLLSKETAIALPLIVVYCELFFFRDESSSAARLQRLAILVAVFALPTILYFGLRYSALAQLLGGMERHPLALSLATIPLATVKYMKLLVLPVGYSYQHYTNFVDSVAKVEFIGPLALLIVLTIVVIKSGSRTLAFSAVWFIVMLAPSLYALRQFEKENLIQDRYLYLPSIGFCMAAALAIVSVPIIKDNVKFSRNIKLAVTTLVLALLTTAHIIQNGTWSDEVALFKQCVQVDSASAAARVSLARALFQAGMLRQAENEAQAALAIDPNHFNAYSTLSYFAHSAGRLDKAVEYLELAAEATRADPYANRKLATIYLNTGLIQWEQKVFDRAEKNLLRSIETWERPVGWYHAGRFYFDQGRYQEARLMFELCRQEVPRWYAPIHMKLGQVYEQLGERALAREAYQEFLHLTPPGTENRNQVSQRLQQL
jgi:tetratricopeptide (TPR) repeat protein